MTTNNTQNNAAANVNLVDALLSALGQKKTQVAEVQRSGDKLIIPELMTTEGAINVLQKQLEADEQDIGLDFFIPVFPWEGAMALQRAIDDVLGFVELQEVRSFFGKRPPTKVTIPVGPNQTADVYWGRIGINPDGSYLNTSADFRDDVVGFVLGGVFKRKHEPVVKKIIERLQHHIRESSLYRGRPLAVSFRDEDFSRRGIPLLSFYDISTRETDALTFNRDIEQMIGANVLAPIQYREAAKEAGIPFKRGTLLAGPYGTGKTLLARKVAQVAAENGVTFIYLKDVRELADAIAFARQMQPAVIFSEDIDRAMGEQKRTVQIDQILNILDGIDSKNTDIMVVLTTNHLENVNKAMLRPGRIDVLVNVLPPDAEASVRLVQVYGGSLLSQDDFSPVGRALAGKIPAVIREIVERSKLVHLWRTGKTPETGSITPADIEAAAKSMSQQLEVLNEKVEPTLSDTEKAAKIISEGLVDAAKVHAILDAAPSDTEQAQLASAINSVLSPTAVN